MGYINSISPDLLTPNELWATRELARLERESEKQERRRDILANVLKKYPRAKHLKDGILRSLVAKRDIDKQIKALRNALRGM